MRSRPHKRKRHTSARRVSVRAIRRAEPDAKKLSQAIIALAIAKAEADARASHRKTEREDRRSA